MFRTYTDDDLDERARLKNSSDAAVREFISQARSMVELIKKEFPGAPAAATESSVLYALERLEDLDGLDYSNLIVSVFDNIGIRLEFLQDAHSQPHGAQAA